MRATIRSIVILLFFPVITNAATLFNSNCRNALYQILNFNFEIAHTYILSEENSNPSNLFIPYLYNYIDFLKITFNESPQDLLNYKQLFPQRLKKINQSPENIPYKLFFSAELHLQSSIIYAKFNDKFKAFRSLYSAQKIIVEYRKSYPEFTLRNKHLPPVLFINSYLPQMVRNFIPIPDGHQDAFLIFEDYKKEIKSDTLLQLESDIIESFLLLQFGNNACASFTKVHSFIVSNPDNILLNFSGTMIAMHCGKPNEGFALSTRQLLTKSETPLILSKYLLGEIKLNSGQDGSSYFEDFLTDYAGSNYVKSAWLRLGWSYLLKGDTAKFNECRKYVFLKGSAFNDSDIQSVNEAADAKFPNIHLLKARLFFDGGFYNRARELLLTEKSRASLHSMRDKLEYIYRLARINHAENDTSAAKNYYLQVIRFGKKAPYYFAANSALQMGLFEEAGNNSPKAAEYYQLSISLNQYGYKESIGAKAKNGLKRVSR